MLCLQNVCTIAMLRIQNFARVAKLVAKMLIIFCPILSKQIDIKFEVWNQFWSSLKSIWSRKLKSVWNQIWICQTLAKRWPMLEWINVWTKCDKFDKCENRFWHFLAESDSEFRELLANVWPNVGKFLEQRLTDRKKIDKQTKNYTVSLTSILLSEPRNLSSRSIRACAGRFHCCAMPCASMDSCDTNQPGFPKSVTGCASAGM